MQASKLKWFTDYAVQIEGRTYVARVDRIESTRTAEGPKGIESKVVMNVMDEMWPKGKSREVKIHPDQIHGEPLKLKELQDRKDREEQLNQAQAIIRELEHEQLQDLLDKHKIPFEATIPYSARHNRNLTEEQREASKRKEEPRFPRDRSHIMPLIIALGGTNNTARLREKLAQEWDTFRQTGK